MLTILHLRNPDNGKPYRKTLQYGFDLQQAVDAMAGRKGLMKDKLRRFDDPLHSDADIETDMYACAFLPPNYPLPTTLYTSALAMDYERVMPRYKLFMLNWLRE